MKKPRYQAPKKNRGGRKKQYKNPILGKYQVPLEKRCGLITKTGKPCGAPKLTTGGPDAHCYLHTPKEELPQLPWTPFLPPDNTEDLIKLLADIALRIRNEELDPKIGGSVAGVARELLKALTIQKKLDPKEIAQRAYSREAAIKLAQQLTIEQAREIARTRSTISVRETIEAQVKELEVHAQPEND